jgi:DNA-binding Xre family transcriptional regulator
MARTPTTPSPARAAEELRASAPSDSWLDSVAGTLLAGHATGTLTRVMAALDMNQTDVSRVFAVSRQAVQKWLAVGEVPTAQRVRLADLEALCDLTAHYVKPDRLPAVVRRPTRHLDDRSLLDALPDDPERVLAYARWMLDLTRAHGA